LGAKDECFVLREHDILIRLYDLVDHINSHQTEFSSQWFDTRHLLSLRRSNGVSDSYAANISESRRDEPLLVCQIAGEHWIVDGNHRLRRRTHDGLVLTPVMVVPADTLLQFVERLDL
jgi:hypothetical protein